MVWFAQCDCTALSLEVEQILKVVSLESHLNFKTESGAQPTNTKKQPCSIKGIRFTMFKKRI
jgi:hypothetical protein